MWLGPEVRRHSGKTTRSDRLVQIGTRIRNQLRALAMCIRVKRKARLLVHGECDLQLTRTYLSACSCSHRFSSWRHACMNRCSALLLQINRKVPADESHPFFHAGETE